MVERERTSSFHRGISLGSDSENARFYTGFAYLQRVLAGVRFFTLTLLELSDPGFLFSHRALLGVLAFFRRMFRSCRGQKPATCKFRGQLGIYDSRRLGALLLP
jgi:hypothetical protein